MSIKKAFQDVVAFLEDNENSKVKSVLPAVIEMCSAKSGGAGGAQSFIKDANDNVTHIKCYYHGVWEPVNSDGTGDDEHCAYGAKATSATKLSNMCKEGTSNWTKQQAAAKKAGVQLLNDVAAGDVAPEDILDEQASIEVTRKAVYEREDGLGSEEMPAS